ncbi:2-keto-4-pentenoate hydratase [Aurantiacibacter rhizosphaerae]|uniref:2-keto-4-pentenoate hydratase n=1 Tax=Aurantiacibacter rhizosphaerae TaxID=2691582 RepID=A0A844XGF7_9SPHN|nr:hypothetical protein [Aurantiacibacter rhizosphaerae]MWV28674.1 hypothetical protein [Aurantiacibacter rhizosphaerae]
MMQSNDELELALFRAAGSQFGPVPLPDVEPDLAGAYDIQRRVHNRRAMPVMAWKLGLTGEGAREAFGTQEPAIGRLPASAIYNNRTEVSFHEPEVYVEAELVFELGQDLEMQSTPYTRADICDALQAIYGGIEIVRTRFTTSVLSLPLLIADNCMAHGLLWGKKLASGWEDRFADMGVTLSRNGEAPVSGSSAAVMGNPLDAVVWLANWLRENEGYALQREQLIASGTCTGVTQAFAGDTFTASFDGEEAARVSFRMGEA